jgi:uncharacterized SAM-binding protein YcdF (DUF218 family)
MGSFFILSKVLWVLVRPQNLIFELIIFGLILVHWPYRGRRLGWMMILLGLGIYGVSTFTTLPSAGLAVIENRFPRQEVPPDLEGIILLGGAVGANRITQTRGTASVNDAAERVLDTISLAHRYPQAKILLSGFSGSLTPTGQTEAELTRKILLESGITEERIIEEDQSINTHQNAVNTVKLIGTRPADKWVLVTSAFHMPRSIGCFAQQGWTPRAYTTDYRTELPQPIGFTLMHSDSGNLNTLIHETIGLVAYWLTDRIPTLFPAPAQ